jgi:hypothetical protein
MKKVIISLIVLIGLIVIFSKGGCEFNVSTAKVADAKICTSLSGDLCNNDNPVISPNTREIYASCLLKNATENTKVKFSWVYYGNTKIDIDNVTLNSGNKIGNLNLHSSLSRPTKGWPKGEYEVVIQVQTDNAEPVTKQFSIK